MRILRNADFLDGKGGGGEPEAKAPTTPTPPPPAGVDPEVLRLIEGLRKDLHDKTAALGQYQSKDDAERQKKLADKGDYERLIKERDDKLADLTKAAEAREAKVRTAERDRGVLTALNAAGVDLVPGAAAQLLKLWAGEFEAEEIDGTFRVQTKDFKTPAQVVRERLASADYEHFVKASSRGKGVNRGDGSRSEATGTGDAAKPGSMLDYIVARQTADRAPGGPQHEKPQGFRRPAK